MSTASILSILVYPQSRSLLVYHMGLSLVPCSYLYIGSLQLDFHTREVGLLGNQISDDRISMAIKKVEEFTAWSPP